MCLIIILYIIFANTSLFYPIVNKRMFHAMRIKLKHCIKKGGRLQQSSLCVQSATFVPYLMEVRESAGNMHGYYASEIRIMHIKKLSSNM